MTTARFRRADLKPGDNLCEHCTALCCQYFTLQIDEPTEWQDFDHMRWFLMHRRAAVFVDDDAWYLTVYAVCEHLRPDNMCGVYYERPQICRAYSTDHCEYDDQGVYDMYFETAEQIWEYAQAILPPREPRQFSPKPVEPQEIDLPIFSGVSA